jgi:hypothetical protein
MVNVIAVTADIQELNLGEDDGYMAVGCGQPVKRDGRFQRISPPKEEEMARTDLRQPQAARQAVHW